MKWHLVVDRGQHKGEMIPVRRTSFSIGRDAACHLRPSSASVSERHCVLTLHDDELFVVDCQSTNGTFVNDQRLEQERSLHPGDRLHVGPLVFIVGQKPSVIALSRGESDEEAIAQILLDMEEGGPQVSPDSCPSRSETSNTVPGTSSCQETTGTKERIPPSNKLPGHDTKTAASEILRKYMRRRGDGVNPRRP